MADKDIHAGTLIHQQPLKIGGDTVHSQVSARYMGACAVMEDNNAEKLICAFSCPSEALSAAQYATTPDGGYGSVLIRPCDPSSITHSTFRDWLCR